MCTPLAGPLVSLSGPLKRNHGSLANDSGRSEANDATTSHKSLSVIDIALVVALSSALGAAYERRHLHARAVTRVILKLMLYVLVPFVGFVNLAHFHLSVGAGAGLVCSYAAMLLAGTLALLVGRDLLRLERPAVGALICTTIVANTGYVGFPMTLALLGPSALGSAVAFDALLGGPMLYVFAFAVGAAFCAHPTPAFKPNLATVIIRNPPLLGAAAGLLAPAALAPDALVNASHIVVAGLLPLGFFAVGVSLSATARDSGVRLLRRPDLAVAASVALRLAVAPLLLAVLRVTLVHVPSAYILQSAMPTGVNVLIVGHAYGLDERLIATTVAWTTAAVLGLGLVIVAA